MLRLGAKHLTGTFCLSAALIYLYPLTLSTPLLEPDEGLHATISQEMLETGNWVVPTFRGEPFLDKPALYFWAQMVSLKTLGMTEQAVRLPGLLFALLGALTTGLLANRLFNREVGLVAGLAASTMVVPMALAQAAVHDVALVPWTNLAMLCLWELRRASSRRSELGWLCGAVLMLALAMLTKGLLGVALTAVGFGGFLLVRRSHGIRMATHLLVAVVGGIVVALPWFLAVEARVPGYLYYYFVERHLLGYVTTSQPHGHEPWYYYLPVIALGAMPWVYFLIPLSSDEWSRRRTRRSDGFLLVVSWLFSSIIFLSTARSKLATYALPVFPAIATLCAVSWYRFRTGEFTGVNSAWFCRLIGCAGFAGIVAPLAGLAVSQSYLDTAWPLSCWLVAGAVSGLSVCGLMALRQRQLDGVVTLLPLWTATFICMVMTWPLQPIAERHSERELAQWLNTRPELPSRLLLVGEKPASVYFYLTPERRSQLRPGQLQEVTAADLNQQQCPDSDIVVAITQKAVQSMKSMNGRVPNATMGSVGQFQLFHLRSMELSLAEAAGQQPPQ